MAWPRAEILRNISELNSGGATSQKVVATGDLGNPKCVKLLETCLRLRRFANDFLRSYVEGQGKPRWQLLSGLSLAGPG